MLTLPRGGQLTPPEGHSRETESRSFDILLLLAMGMVEESSEGVFYLHSLSPTHHDDPGGNEVAKREPLALSWLDIGLGSFAFSLDPSAIFPHTIIIGIHVCCNVVTATTAAAAVVFAVAHHHSPRGRSPRRFVGEL
jgi:hypothetical protein